MGNGCSVCTNGKLLAIAREDLFMYHNIIGSANTYYVIRYYHNTIYCRILFPGRPTIHCP